MKRDWDLIRKLLTDIEEEKDYLADIPPEPKWGDEPEQEYNERYKAFREVEDRILGHLEMLVDNGYVKGVQVVRSLDGSFCVSRSSSRLTMAGHDLLDTMRSSAVWESIKSTAKSKGIELTFDAIKALGAFALKQLIG